MSSKVFRMWPDVALVLFLAAVWHWSVLVEPAWAQGSSTDPVLELSASTLDSENIVVATDELTITARNFGEGRVWLYLWQESSAGQVPDCLANAVDDNLRDDGQLDASGVVSFTMDVTVPPFSAGPGNRFCLVRRDGSFLLSDAFAVDVRPATYLMQLELDSIELKFWLPRRVCSIHQEVSLSTFGLTVLGACRSGVSPNVAVLMMGLAAYLTPITWLRWTVSGSRAPRKVTWSLVATGRIWWIWRTSRMGSLRLPGNDTVLRLRLPEASQSDLAAERFVVFWGPVDLWLLGTQQSDNDPAWSAGEFEPRSFVVHSEHLELVASELNSRVVQLSPGDYVDLPISSNESGHTFVSLVSCNDRLLGRIGHLQ